MKKFKGNIFADFEMTNVIYNFLLTARANTLSYLEREADVLLTPARYLFGGKTVTIFSNGSMHISKEGKNFNSSNFLDRTVTKILAISSLPFSVIGATLKLLCLIDSSYRAYCKQIIPEESTCHPKLFEIFQHVHFQRRFIETDCMLNLVFKPLNLSECSCSAFHRFSSRRRENLENGIVDRLIKNNLDKNQTISLLSMGSGGLLSDFITLEKLILAGFKKIEIDCVDPIGIDPNRVERVQKFFSQYPELILSIQAYRSIDDVPAEKKNYQAILAVDYDTLATFYFEKKIASTVDLMKAYRRLDINGFIGLGFNDEDTLWGKQMATVILSKKPPISLILRDDLEQNLPQTDAITIGIPSLNFADVTHLWLLCLAVAAEKKGKIYRKISLSCVQRRNEDALAQYQAMMQGLFPASEVDIAFGADENKKCDHFLTGTIEPEFESKKYRDYLHSQSVVYLFSPEGNISRQKNSLAWEKIRKA